MPFSPDRRTFLLGTGRAAGALTLLGAAACRDASREAADAVATDAPPAVLEAGEIRTLEALADAILPPDGEAPGAVGLGAVVFLDRYLARRDDMLDGARAGLGILAEVGGGDFAELDAEGREAALEAFSRHPSGLFGLLHLLVMAGAFAAPVHGGNRDKGGWALLGYDDRHAWQPPFGAYDVPGRREVGP